MKKFAESTAHQRNNRKSINLSDLIEVEERSINSTRSANATPVAEKHAFQPSEFSARSTIVHGTNQNQQRSHQLKSQSTASPSVEQILAESFDESVRGLKPQLENIKLRQSMSSSSDWRRHTADLSLNSSAASSLHQYDWKKELRLSNVSDLNAETNPDEHFISSSQVCSFRCIALNILL